MGLLEYREFGISGEDDRICIDLVEGMWQVWNVRGRDWIVPKRDGRIDGPRRKDTLTLPLAGYVKGIGATATERLESFLEASTALLGVMDASLSITTLRASDGYLGLGTGAEAEIEARVRNGAPGKIQSYRTSPFQLWTFELEVIEGDWVFGS